MKTYFTFMKESHTLYHASYTDAINAALAHHKGLNVSDEDRDTHIAMGPRKPVEGETVKHRIPATDKNGDDHMIDIQVYNKGGNKPFELNTYSSKVSKKKVAEETVDVSEGLGDRYTNDPIGNFSGLKTYAKKLGPKHIDYHDLMVAASHMAFGNSAHLTKHLKTLDTDVRDKVKEYMKEEAELDEMHSIGSTALTYHDHIEAKEMTPAEIKAKHKKLKDTEDYHRKRSKDPNLTSNQRMASSAVASAAKMAAAEWKHKYVKEAHSSDPIGDHRRLREYANSLPKDHVDKDDLLTAASHMEWGNMDHLKKHIKGLDTDVREVVLKHVARQNLQTLGYRVRKEEVDQIDEISSATLVSYSQKAHDQIKGNQPAEPDKLRKRTNREQGIKLAFNKHYQVRTKVPATIKEEEEPLAEISAALAMRASRAATKEVGMGKSNREDKLIGLQKTADEKFRKMLGRSSSAKVATTPEE